MIDFGLIAAACPPPQPLPAWHSGEEIVINLPFIRHTTLHIPIHGIILLVWKFIRVVHCNYVCARKLFKPTCCPAESKSCCGRGLARDVCDGDYGKNSRSRLLY